jgi:superfamily II DNA/RNA helicase
VVDPWQGIEGDAESRGAALLRVLAHEEETVALVFADDKRDSFGALLATLEARLGEEWAVLALQSAMGSAQRTRVMRAFREAPAPRVLLASDVASRGLDVPDITHVVNYDLPRGWEDYCHRAGRAGRYGREGTVVNLVGEGEIFVLERYANALQVRPRPPTPP